MKRRHKIKNITAAALLCACLAAISASVLLTGGGTFAANKFSPDSAVAFAYGYQGADLIPGSANLPAPKGVRVTLTPQPGASAATFEYWNWIDKDLLATGSVVKFSMSPDITAEREAASMMLTMTDALDESQTVSVIWAIGNKHYGRHGTYGNVAFTDKVTVDGSGYSFIAGTPQITQGLDVYGGMGYGGAGNIVAGGSFFETYHGLFSGEPESEGQYTPLFMQDVVYNVSGGKAEIGSQGSRTEPVRVYADLLNATFLNQSSDSLPDTGEYGEIKARYARDYVNNLFSSGRIKLKFTFMGMTKSKVSFKLIEAGGQSLSGVTGTDDITKPLILAEHTTNALKGVEYTLPEARAYDNDGVTAAVLESLAGPGGTVASVGGKFTPSAGGSYTATYTASDVSGNTAKLALVFTCYENYPAVTFGRIAGAVPETVYNAGQTVTLPAHGAYSPLSLKPGGALDVSAAVKLDGVTAAGFPNAGITNAFVIPRAGIYTVDYIARDGFGFVSAQTAAYTFIALPETPQIILPSEALWGIYGESYTFPAVFALYQAQYYRCSAIAVSPSGALLTPDKNGRITLNELGNYTARFVCTAGGQTVIKDAVLESLVSNGQLFGGANYEHIVGNTPFPSYAADRNGSGVLLTALRGATFTFNRVIDLTGADKNVNLLNFLPYSSGIYGRFGIVLTLTDLHNPANKVDITVTSHMTINSYVYVHVNYDGRTLARSTERDGAVVNWSNFGSLHWANFVNPHEGVGVQPFNLRYDAAEKAFYTLNNIGGLWQLLDLDDPDQVGAGREWNGWTTGEVKLSIALGPAAAGGIIVSEIAGQPLSGARLWEKTKPRLYLSAADNFNILPGADDGIIPDAKLNLSYKLPTARAYDGLFGECVVDYNLYPDLSAGVNLWPLDGSAAFTPLQAGAYTLEISSANPYGNKTALKYHFTVKTGIDAITVVFGAPETAYAGLLYTLPPVALSGGSGLLDYQYTAALNGAPVTPDSKGRVLITATGTLVIGVVANDYLGTVKTETLSIAVTARSAPVLTVSGVPQSAFNNRSLVLPDFTAINYAVAPGGAGYNAWRAVSINGTVIFSGRGTDTAGSLSYGVTPADGSALTVKYMSGNIDGAANVTETETFIIPVLSPSYISDYVMPYDITGSYLTGGYGAAGVSVNRSTEGSVFRANTDKAFVLANPLAADGMTLEFGGRTSAAGMTSLTLVLEDYFNPDIALSFEITVSGGGQSYIRPHGGIPSPLVGSFLADNANYILIYNAAQRALVNSAGGIICVPQITLDGEPFKGFPCGAARVRFEARGTGGERAFALRQAGNQMFTASGNTAQHNDVTGPQLIYEYAMLSRDVQFGGQIGISAVRAYDVIQQSASVTVSIRNPAGTLLLNGASCAAAQVITADMYGGYTVTYTARDAAGCVTDASFRFYVKDNVPPVITVGGAPPQTVKAGTAVVIPAAAVTGNYSAVSLFTFIITPDASIVTIGENRSYTFAKAGVYKIVYYAYNGDYTVASQEFTVTVTAA